MALTARKTRPPQRSCSCNSHTKTREEGADTSPRYTTAIHEPQAARPKRTAERPGQGKGPSRGDESSSYRCHSKFERYFPTPLDHVGELTTPLPSASHGGDREKKARGEQKGKREKRKPPSEEEEGRLLLAQRSTVLQQHCTCTAGDG